MPLTQQLFCLPRRRTALAAACGAPQSSGKGAAETRGRAWKGLEIWGLCPSGWAPYRSTLCLFVPANGPVLSWSQARAFCHERKAELIVIPDYNKQAAGEPLQSVSLSCCTAEAENQTTAPGACVNGRVRFRAQIFLTALTDSAGGPRSQYWVGLAQLGGSAELTWVDGTPISKSWYRNWLWSHPKGKHCVQLLGFYLNQWRDWDCNSTSSFICEMPAADAFPSSVRALHFRSHCYTFHFPALWRVRTWPQALAFCKQSGGSLASVQSEEENAFLSDAVPADGWHMWIGLQFSTAWRWSDASSLVYHKWHPAAVANLPGQCAVMALHPSDLSRHGTWETRGCDAQPLTTATGFFCKYSHGPCRPPAPTEFPLPGGMGPYATADVVFSLPRYSACTVRLTKAYTRTALLQLSLESNATHVYGSVTAEFTGASVQKELSPVPFSGGLSTWGFITFPAGMIGFFNHQEHFRVFSDWAISFANLGSLLISGVTVVNASQGKHTRWGLC
ncbi:macrophage mannose receptor 1-like [Emydura macquarii macquarii]|uniref:macrophage mannose receptor 1-like n=1 Tax=Emydura macquarii macquarii TaxID=1129001 RepID=UPI00352AE903